MALVDAVDDAADIPALFTELESAADDPRRQLAALARFEGRLFGGARDLLRLLHEGARHSDELAAAYRDGEARGEEGRRRVLGGWPPAALRDDLDLEAALDICAAGFSYELWEILSQRGWSSDRIAEWVAQMLARELLRPDLP
jgi:hypothetical protein